ncbi:MAG: hypothetical protein HKN47_11070 [Pirellulaceae bacterium]|nr:hypothetical protein [Pirellulaceae bacterium]
MFAKRIIQFSIRGVLVLTLVSAAVASHYRPREIAADITPIRFNKKAQTATFLITNTAHNDLWLYGYSSDSPFYSVEGLVGGRWQGLGLGWCGTGAGLHVLEKGESTKFGVSWYDPNTTAIRVSVTFYEQAEDYENSRSIQSKVLQLGTNSVAGGNLAG